MREPVVHFRNVRLYVNAGMAFPECRANDKLLDVMLEAITTGDRAKVTCKRCIRKLSRKGRFV